MLAILITMGVVFGAGAFMGTPNDDVLGGSGTFHLAEFEDLDGTASDQDIMALFYDNDGDVLSEADLGMVFDDATGATTISLIGEATVVLQGT